MFIFVNFTDNFTDGYFVNKKNGKFSGKKEVLKCSAQALGITTDLSRILKKSPLSTWG